MAKVLVTGGAGYVGGSVVCHLLDQGHDVWIVDDLSTGYRSFVRGRGFTLARVGDPRVLDLMKRERFDAVMHFAAWTLVGESVQKPDEYHENNVEQTAQLLKYMRETGIRRFVFSSTCAIFGDVGNQNITEDLDPAPLSPYGQNKQWVEAMLEQASTEWGLQAIPLRYFNAAGAEPLLRVGESHEPESHLIPNVFRAALDGGTLKLFGTDYSTPDGTCVRDYIHVSDLASAHLAALEKLMKLPPNEGHFRAYNLGSENGASVRQVIDECQKVIQRELSRRVPVEVHPRRPGDAPRLVGDSTRARKELGFKPQHDLRSIVESAWAWEKKRRAPRKAVFLDRDGTINFDPGYLSNPNEMNLLPGAGEALEKLANAGWELVVISNQSGVGRGLIPRENIPALRARMDSLLAPFGAKIRKYQFCFHTPEEKCPCRKPGTKLIEDAARELFLDIQQSVFIGDRDTDLQAGRRSKCGKVILVRTGDGRKTEAALAPGTCDHVADDLAAAASWILNQ
jgi:UDP-glucose 4-epimerase